MNKNTKLTLAELLKRKEQMLSAKKTKRTLDLYVKSIDATITIEEPTGALCRDANDMEPGEGDKYMCYECIKEPNLKSQEAQDAFGCADPMDIVECIFAPGEIPQIAIECMKLAGYMGGVEAVKN
ncbi:MAG: phage portal protein [Clostridia bacterium]|nr:phage portal protein [Clostridia bacterium]MBQ3426082.1 phage portal protein [Clostridia bacterium]